MNKRAVLFAFSILMIGLIIGLTVSVKMNVHELTFAKETGISSDTTRFLGKLSSSLSEVAEAVKPSVVNISTTKTVTMKQRSPFDEFFNDPLLRKFFGDRFGFNGEKRKYQSSALGSGVVVTDDGYILTNNHVVKDADEIKVVLYDKREFKGRVVGSDPKSDLAVIKIDAGGDLPAIKIGESDSLKVGDVVLAIGNPFGLSQTITMGIVSAVGRSNVGIADYEDFIQTDAAINPGNSGGALVNTRGELVGINTAIFSTNGGYMGIGFAIPSDMAKAVMESIIKYGKVVRGWLGVTIQDLTPELARHFDIKEKTGALVTDVIKDSPAEKAGFKRGDLIVEFARKRVRDATNLRNMVADTSPGKTIEVKVIREGEEKILDVTIAEFPETLMTRAGSYQNVLKGIHVQEITAELRKALDIPEKVTGVIITGVEDESPAYAYGILRKNDIIQEINRKAIKGIEDYERAASGIGKEESVLLLVYRAGGYIYVTIRP
ncbi:putative periplasmic serine endoprotease DegP-like precursor [bacterium BMS3Bbin06]|nr:putative periplasmic serine endoprotease DegP-like precursor [bacterium BMS3Bbin06]HDO36300.1 DegQ family serine endoprotease [Nitrospirota bacterium]